MTEKLVYQTDRGGFFVGAIEADPSPLETGVFLIPAGCVEIEPPAIPEGMVARWDGSAWRLEVFRSEPEPTPEPGSEPEPDPQTPEQIRQAYVDAIQFHMDAVARTYNYDDIKSAVTYAEEPVVPRFQQEGRAFRAWRSLVWGYAYTQLDLVMSGEREQPTIEQILSELPGLEIPEIPEPAPEIEPEPEPDEEPEAGAEDPEEDGEPT